MATLRHPHIVAFYGVCTTAAAACIVTEYCAKGSLTQVLRQARTEATAAAALTWPKRLRLALDAALGMRYLHARSPPIIHRSEKLPPDSAQWLCYQH